MTHSLKIAIAGLGTVGAGVVKLLHDNAALIERRAGKRLEIVAVNARDRSKDRGIDMSRLAWADSPPELLAHKPNVVVELMGGSEGAALELAHAAIAQGVAVVTANKAMVAHHGYALAQAAEAAGLPFKYEAAVAGGIPVIKGLREGMAANRILSVYGILNGTCNYILSTMESAGSEFGAVLADAQALGFAEADPSFDVDGIDAAHKLSILASLCFGTHIAFQYVTTTGIRAISAADIREARALGYYIRLVGMAQMESDGLHQAVQPCLVPHSHPLASVTGAMNAVVAEGDYVGQLFFEGRGAGEGPTASAVVADLIDIARGDTGAVFSMPVAQLTAVRQADAGSRTARHYLRFVVANKVGVLAELTAAMRDAGVSIETLVQRGEAADGSVLLVLMTHEAKASAVAQALAALGASPHMLTPPMHMPILV
jgi:homoserine dehydrogenase